VMIFVNPLCSMYVGVPLSSSSCGSQRLGGAALYATEEEDGHVLLNSRIVNEDIYQKQGDNIITWPEPCPSGKQDRNKSRKCCFLLAMCIGCMSLYDQGEGRVYVCVVHTCSWGL
jgi:hypothetical protein